MVTKTQQYDESVKRAAYAQAILDTRNQRDVQRKAEKNTTGNSGGYIRSFGRGLYSIVDKTIELAGKVVSPIYKEAVRPAFSAVYKDGKALIQCVGKGGYNDGKGLLKLIGRECKSLYNAKQESKKTKRQKQEERTIRQRTESESTGVQDLPISCNTHIQGEMYEDQGEMYEKLEEDLSGRVITEDTKIPKIRLRNLEQITWRLTDEELSEVLNGLTSQYTTTNNQVADSPDDTRNRVGRHVRDPEPTSFRRVLIPPYNPENSNTPANNITDETSGQTEDTQTNSATNDEEIVLL